ncbi:MAG: SRPBCC family protein [Balneola sp.]|nr:MAG: SRPBCC family protein [Balneola sp.]
MESINFTESIEINCSPNEAFDYTQDYTQRLDWDTFLKHAELIEGASKADKGVKAYCVAKNGFGMVTEYVSFNRPKVTAIKMTKGPYLFKSFSGSWTFKAIEANLCNVIFKYSFTLRFPFSLFGKFVRGNLESNVRQRLIDLKTNLES